MASTVIGEGLTIEGEITSEEDIEILGTVRGTVSSRDVVTVVDGALVEANLDGASVAVGGSVTGNVTSGDRVDIQAGGRLVGDVKTSRLTIADGATFKGSVDMDV